MRFSKQLPGLQLGRRSLGLTVITFALVGATVASAQATVSPGPAWSIVSKASPTRFEPGLGISEFLTSSYYSVLVQNVGSQATDGSPIRIVDDLPEELTVAPESWGTDVGTTPDAYRFYRKESKGLTSVVGRFYDDKETSCSIGTPVVCTISNTPVRPGEDLVMYVPVEVNAGVGTALVNHVSVSGGGVSGVSSATEATTVASEHLPFSFQSTSSQLTDASGATETRAGAHPYRFQLSFEMTTNTNAGSDANVSPGSLRNVRTVLPRGMVINPQATPSRCTERQLEEEACPESSVVGQVQVILGLSSSGLSGGGETPIYNMVPTPGVPAELAFNVAHYYAHLRGGVDASGNYALTADAAELLQYGGADGAYVELWGNPSDPSHNFVRGGCLGLDLAKFPEGCAVSSNEKPFVTLPSACSGPLVTRFEVESWQEPGKWISAEVPTTSQVGSPVGVTGCGELGFDPSIQAQPGSRAPDSPTSLHVGLTIPQHEETRSYESRATANLKDVDVALPAGLVVNPSAAAGLGACSEAQMGYEGVKEGAITFSDAPAQCPDAAKLGTIEAQTPLLESALHGEVFLAKQTENPFGSMLALYIAIHDQKTGVVVKLAGEVKADSQTGRLTAVFKENPELPIEHVNVDLSGGQRAPLTTPSLCGRYTTETDLTPWSAPGGRDAYPDDSFEVGGACAHSEGEEPNAPSFEAGTVSPSAGGYSPFVFKLSREDGSQRFGTISVTLPLGVVGKLAGIPRCSQSEIERAQARSGLGEGKLEQQDPSCTAASELGTVTVGAGSGSPFYVTGQAYLAGPYEGAPFSAVVITPAVAGPFDLGVVVVRAGLYVDSNTAQVTVKSDPLPRILDGIPLDIRSVAVNAARSQFVLNPTSCEPMSVTGQETSTVGRTAALSERFQVGGCSSLGFAPSFAASTQAKAAPNGNGASLTVNVGFHPGEANIRKVEAKLPKLLPSRLTTLQKACPERAFLANPASCPAESNVGTATAITPILDEPLRGPAYLVSHGGAEFPDLELVLQGEGITLTLDGKTEIKNGVTTSRFETVPDAPVSSFKLELPEGPHSALGVPRGANLCYQPLIMPTLIVGQNGKSVQQNTQIQVSECPYALKLVHRTVKKQTATLQVYVPQAGRLAVTGRGIFSAGKKVSGRQTITIALKERQAGKLNTEATLSFTPASGKQRKIIRTTIRLSFR